jgi:hypothetical protein
MSAWLCFRLFLLALMAAIILLAANFEAFRYMNQFPLFRTIRNYVIFFLMLLGRMAASAFATVTGQEQKPRIEQIHQATVLVVEIFTATLLVSTLSSIFDVVTSMIARKNLQKLKIEVKDIDRSFGDLRLLYCPNLIGLDECEREPCKNVYDAVKCLDKFDVFKAPRAAKDEASQLAAEDAYSGNLTLIEEQAKALLELVGDVKKESSLINRIKIAVSSINQLPNRFSVFTRDPEISEDLKKSVQEAGIIHTRLHVFSILLNIYCGALAEFNRISLVRRRSAQDKLDAAVRAVEYFNLQAEQQMKKTERKIVPRKNILANVVIICLLVSSGYIAWKHSQTSTTTRKSSSPSTQMALLENYFQTSEFSSSFTILGLQIVGAHPPLPPSSPT